MSCQKFETPFFRALNASYVPGASVKHDPLKFKPQVCNPHVPANKYPLAASLFEATDDWKWLNSEAIYDVREEATLHREAIHIYSGCPTQPIQRRSNTRPRLGPVEREIVVLRTSTSRESPYNLHFII